MNEELIERIKAAWTELDAVTVERIVRFHGLLADENQRQNLTRLISPQDFVDGHLLDVRALLESGFVDYPAMDLGSGCGVPGVLAAMIREESWILAESERHKAEFLFRVTRELGLTAVRVVADRGENFLAESGVSSIVARAVGPVERIYAWLHGCSTWNNLVLLKGPGWAAEWEAFQQSRFRKDLRVEQVIQYAVGPDQKKRCLVRLERVPRGT